MNLMLHEQAVRNDSAEVSSFTMSDIFTLSPPFSKHSLSLMLSMHLSFSSCLRPCDLHGQNRQNLIVKMESTVKLPKCGCNFKNQDFPQDYNWVFTALKPN